MKRRSTHRSIVSLAALACVISWTSSSRVAAQAPPPRRPELVDRSQDPKYKEGRLLVRFRPNVTKAVIQAAHDRIGSTVLSEPKIVDGLQIVQLKPGLGVTESIRRYRAENSVLYAEPEYIVKAFDIIPNDPRFSSQWNMKNTGQTGGKPGADIHATQAWSAMTGSSNVVVVALDTGMDYRIREVLTAPRSPWQNAFVERLIGSIRRECLDHVIVLDESSLRRMLKSYLEYYDHTRTHLSLAKDAPIPRSIQPLELGRAVELPQVGGLHHRYERRAA